MKEVSRVQLLVVSREQTFLVVIIVILPKLHGVTTESKGCDSQHDHRCSKSELKKYEFLVRIINYSFLST